MSCNAFYKVTLFESPYSFYIVPVGLERVIYNIEKQFKAIKRGPIVQNIQPEQLYLSLDVDGNYKRVQILSLENEGYYCWLLDYGCKSIQTIFYNLPKNYLYKALSLHVGLSNVVGLTMNINKETGMPEYKPSPNFTIGSIKLIIRHIKGAKKIAFEGEFNYNNVYYGQLILDSRCGYSYNLINTLTRSKVISVDEEMFRTVISSKSINITKEDIKICGIGRGTLREGNIDDAYNNYVYEKKIEHVQQWIESIDREYSYTSDGDTNDDVAKSTSLDKMKHFVMGRGRGRMRNTARKENLGKIPDLPLNIDPNTDSNVYETDNIISWQDNEKTSEKEVIEDSPSGVNQIYSSYEAKDNEKISEKEVIEDSTTGVNKMYSSKDNECVSKDNEKVLENCSSELLTNPNCNNLSQRENVDLIEVDIPIHSTNNTKGTITFGCSCRNCKFWNISDLQIPNNEVFEIKSSKEIMKPPQFFKNSDESIIDIKSVNTRGQCITNKATISNLLVHGTVIPTIQKTRKEVPFHPKIHEAMRSLNYVEAKSVQAYGWPTLMRNMNLCIVSGSRSGKTMTYIPAICSFLLEKEDRYINLPNAKSPIVIVLTLNSKIAEDIYNLFIILFKKIKSKVFIKTILAVPPLDGKLMDLLNSNCDILIATPSTIITLIAKNIINLKRTCHVIIESIDQLLDVNHKELYQIFKVVNEMLEHRKCINPVQLICNAERWSLKLENMLKLLKSTPIVIIGNHLQSALYGRADIQFLDSTTLEKPKKLYDILQQYYDIYKSVVICNQEDIDIIKNVLQTCGVRLVIADNTMTGQDIHDSERAWMQSTNGQHIVLICTDQVMASHLKINNASLLLHYSMANTWTIFSKRFSCLLNSYKSPLIQSNDKFNCKIFVFIDNNSMAPRLAHFIKGIGGEVPENLATSCKVFTEKEEENKLKLGINLCKVLQTTGICDAYRCRYRHKLSKTLDQNTNLPNKGIIKYKILEIREPTSFVIKLLECTDDDGKVTKFPDQAEVIMNYLENSKFLEYARNFEVNKFYVYEQNNKKQRCKLCSIIDFNSVTKLPLNIEIEDLDTASISIIPALNLFEMPDMLRTIPPICIQLYIANLVPKHNEIWTHRQKNILLNSLTSSGYKDPDVFCTSQILLVLQNTIWVNNVHLQVFLPELNDTVNKLNLKKFLFKMDLAMEKEYLNSLYSLCHSYDIQLPNYEIERKTNNEVTKEVLKPQWAYFSEDTYNPVYFCCGNPSQFYVRLIKFDNLLINLQKTIQKVVFEPFYTKLEVDKISVGKYYLAKDSECDYCRVVILNIENNSAKCFYLDYGDTDVIELSELKSLRRDLIEKLPFQAIECRLYGLTPIEDFWQTEAVDILYNYCFLPNTDIFRELNIYLFPNIKEGLLKCNTNYSVALIDYTSTSPRIINKLIYDCGFALENPNESLNFNLPEKINEYINSDEEEKIIDINDIDRDPSEFDFNPEDLDNDDDWDMEIFDNKRFVEECNIKVNDQIGTRAIESKIEESNVIYHPIKVAASPQYGIYTPTLQWYQTNGDIKIEIKLIDVEEYNICLKPKNILSFSTNHNNKNYEFSYELYSNVLPDVIHINMKQHIKVHLKKEKEDNWPRLLLSDIVMKNIKYNFDKTTIVEECGKERKFLEIGEDLDDGVDEVYVHDIPSDVDYSESDIEEYDEECN